MQGLHILRDMAPEDFPVKIYKRGPVQILGGNGRVFHPCSFPKGSHGILRVIKGNSPAVRIHPGTINIVLFNDLLQLGYHQFVQVWAEQADHHRIPRTIGMNNRPLGMIFDGSLVPQVRVMNHQRHVANPSFCNPGAGYPTFVG